MDILSFVGIRLKCPQCSKPYEVPLRDVLLSHQMMHEGCPVLEETECPPVFQSRLFPRSAVEALAAAWRRLEKRAQGDGGELVVMTGRNCIPENAAAIPKAVRRTKVPKTRAS
ncbi:MAG TPA: hypothetical protein VJN64_13470 [Terriglobales bacterium]|nr:hypothetical protein [Terriglobales bacterium]